MLPLNGGLCHDLSPIACFGEATGMNDQHIAGSSFIDGPVQPEIISRRRLDRKSPSAQSKSWTQGLDGSRQCSLFASRFMKACCREISCALNEGIGLFFILQDALPFPFEVQQDINLSSIHDDRMYVSLCFTHHGASGTRRSRGGLLAIENKVPYTYVCRMYRSFMVEV